MTGLKFTDIVSFWVFVGCLVLAAVSAIWSDWFMVKWLVSAAFVAFGIGLFTVGAQSYNAKHGGPK